MPDLIIKNADIITMDPGHPGAGAMAVKGGRILALGREEEIMARRTAHTLVLDLDGKALCPGFIDAHLHFRAMAESFIDVDLSPGSGIRCIGDIRRRIEEEAKKTPEGGWIRAAGYDETDLAELRHPNRLDLDPVSGSHPVKLTHRSTYAHVLNGKALEAAGIHCHTDDPAGGIIERDLETGDPTGVVFNLGAFLNERIPGIDDDGLARGVDSANRELLSVGITSFQDASVRNDGTRFRWFLDLKKRSLLVPRVMMMTGYESRSGCETLAAQLPAPSGVSLGGVKIIIDETTGKIFPCRKDLDRMVLSLFRRGVQAVIHAIEETAIAAALEAFGKALSRFPDSVHGSRIEHCSVCPPDLCRKIADLGIMVVTHPAFIYYNGDRYLKTVPAHQSPHLYPISLLLENGVAVAAGSDGPLVKADPLSGIYGAVTRMTRMGKILPGGRGISAVEALGMYTVQAARAGVEQSRKGSLSIGKYADFIVLSANPLKVSPDTIKGISVEMTFVDGELAWSRESGEK